MLMACKPPWSTQLDEPPPELLDEVDRRLESIEQEYEGFRGIRNLKFISFLEGSKFPGLDDIVCFNTASSFAFLFGNSPVNRDG